VRARCGLVAAAVALLLALVGVPASGSPPADGRAEPRVDAAGGDVARSAASGPRCRGKARGRRARIRRARARCARIRRLAIVPQAPERLTPGAPVPGDPPGGGTPDDPGDPGPPPPPPPPRFVSVAAREWSLTLSRPLVGAGSVTVELQNAGEDPHNLIVSPDDDSHDPLAAWPELLPGENARRSVTLSTGRYLLWCSLEGHEASGMSVRLRVE